MRKKVSDGVKRSFAARKAQAKIVAESLRVGIPIAEGVSPASPPVEGQGPRADAAPSGGRVHVSRVAPAMAPAAADHGK
jgi:hypothetical protein